jgi:cyanophycinase
MPTTRRLFLLTLALTSLFTSACVNNYKPRSQQPLSPLRGTLLAIGGGLEDDNAPVYERFAQLARQGAGKRAPRIVIVTTASGDEPDAQRGKRESFAVWCPQIPVDVIGRDTPSADAVATIDAASALFFTGGDQKRITTKYRPANTDTPEWLAMQRLLARGGVIAGTSAGAAMMGDIMFFSGRSAPALGIIKEGQRGVAFDPDNPIDDEDAVVIGPRIGPGMKLVPWALIDSHFFERDRIGRLVAALEDSSARLGIGVGEDACVEINLATGEVTGTSVAASLLVDRAWLTREGLTRRGGIAYVLAKGDSVHLASRLTTKFAAPKPRPAGEPTNITIAEPGQSRQLASWRVFVRSSEGLHAVDLGGWSVVTWPDNDGWVGFDIEVPANPR